MRLLLVFLVIGFGFSACDGESVPFPDEKEIQRQDAYDDDQYKEQELLP